ncbi:hypothetical protein V1477_018241 [Vespula maculifrons]|uniref:Uncharacterized protein n=2 Tax=Vespula TaxID=7451 RepID=A0A834NKE3_VESVU|nr:hypothetical protein HZH66_001563 [Vespula vulgaris]
MLTTRKSNTLQILHRLQRESARKTGVPYPRAAGTLCFTFPAETLLMALAPAVPTYQHHHRVYHHRHHRDATTSTPSTTSEYSRQRF